MKLAELLKFQQRFELEAVSENGRLIVGCRLAG